MRDEIDLAFEICLDNFLDPFVAQGKFPMASHHVDAELKRRIDHVLPLGPQRRRRALPGVATVEQQGTRARSFQLLHQRCEMREAANFAVLARGLIEIQIGERMRFGTAGLDTEMRQQIFTNQMRRLPHRSTDANIDIGLAKIAWHQLGMTVGHVQEMHIAKARQVIHRAAIAICCLRLTLIEYESACTRNSEQAQKFTAA